MAEDITAVPFAPLGGGDGGDGGDGGGGAASQVPQQPQQPQQPPPPGLESLFDATYTPSTQQSIAEQTQLASQKLQGIEQATTGFVPIALATAAALSGNFGPALQLQERRRQAQVGQRLLPVASQIGQLEASGKLEEARAVAETAALRAGDNAPEVSRVLQGMLKRIDDKQTRYKQAADVVKILKNHIDKDDPRYKFVKSLDIATKNRSDITESTMNNFLTAARIHTQIVGGQIVQSNEATPNVTTRPAPVVTDPSKLHNYVGYQLSGAYGLTAEEMTNLINGVDITVNGQTISSKGDIARRLRDDYNELQPLLGDISVGEKIQTEPILNNQLLAQNVSPLDVLTKKYGMKVGTALAAHQQRLIEQARAPIIAKYAEDPYAAQQSGVTYIDTTPGPTFGSEKIVPYSVAQASGGAIVPVRQSVRDKVFEPALQAMQGLSYVANMYQALGNPQELYDQLNAFTNRAVGKLTGQASDKVLIAQAAEAIVRRSIERVENTEGVNAKEIGQLKSMMTSSFNDPQDVINVAKMLQGRLQAILGRAIGGKAIPVDQIPDVMKKQGSGSLGPAVPAATIRDSDGIFKPASPTSTFTPGIKKGTGVKAR